MGGCGCDPYGPVTSFPWLEPGWRCTAYYWAVHRGLLTTLEYLTELGRIAAGQARWAGLEPAQVPEGPYIVHQWPAPVWLAAEARLLPPPPYGPGMVAAIPRGTGGHWGPWPDAPLAADDDWYAGNPYA